MVKKNEKTKMYNKKVLQKREETKKNRKKKYMHIRNVLGVEKYLIKKCSELKSVYTLCVVSFPLIFFQKVNGSISKKELYLQKLLYHINCFLNTTFEKYSLYHYSYVYESM